MKLNLSLKKNKRTSLISKLIGTIETKPASDRLLLRILFFVFITSLLSFFIIWNDKMTEFTAVDGGVVKEGIIGIPRFVNPALAVTRADQDMTALIYSGLMKINVDGTLIPDLAQSVTVSDDGKIYNVILRDDIYFHDNTKITADDVAFTIRLIQNPELKSPARGNWSDVTVEEISDTELNIIPREPYSPFIENFTVGIMPKHIWSNLPIEQIPFSQKNTEPIGSGPFSINKITRDSAGLISKYTLNKFDTNTPVKISGMEIHFFQNETSLISAFEQEIINSTAQLPNKLASDLKSNSEYRVSDQPLPRIFAVFFNQNRSTVLRDTAVRLALTTAIDRDILVDSALSGFGVPIKYPVPPNHPAVESVSESDVSNSSSTIEAAASILTKAGWVKNNNGAWEKRIDGETKVLTITLKTANTPAFAQTTEIIARAWRELGVEVQVEQFEQSDLLQAVIRTRDFESLLFGLDMSRAVDLFPFWHSSQREDPGLNISQYANIEVDKLLEIARTSTSTNLQNSAITDATRIIARETPAAFLYVPNLVYVTNSSINTVSTNRISRPQERFMNIEQWNMNTDKLWPIFK